MPSAKQAIAGATAYLRSAQNADGGIGVAPGTASSSSMAAWAALGLTAAGADPGTTAPPGGPSLADFLEAAAPHATSTGDVQRAILALAAAGRPVAPPLLARLAKARRRDGSYERRVNTTAFAVLALRAAGRRVPSTTLRWLAGQQNRDGGFNFGGRGGVSGADDTSSALQALVAAGRSRRSQAVRRAAAWLTLHQGRDGGFALAPGQRSNAQSTAFAVQGLLAAGRRPTSLHRHGARSPVAYLRTLAGADGAIRYSRTSRQTPVWVTAQALAALAGRSLPILPAAG